MIELMQRLAKDHGVDLGTYTHTYLHLIHCELDSQELVASSKLNAEWDYLRKLFAMGRTMADTWLAENFDRIGVSSTLDFEGMFGGNHMPSPHIASPKAAE